MELDLTWLTGSLAMGGALPEAAAVRLARQHGIRRVVDLRAEACDDVELLRRAGVTLLHLPTDDVRACSAAHLEEGVTWVLEQLAAGEKVLVHCQWGIGRSALLSLCVLVALGCPPLPALRHAKDRRAKVSPSPEQLQALLAFAAGWRDRTGATWELPSLEDLGSVAWRHLAAGADLTAASTEG